jgi:predicted metal-binding protein
MEQKIPKHRPYSFRDLAQRRKVSHTTARRQDQQWVAMMILAHALGEDVATAIQTKQIRVSQEAIWQWSCIARLDPKCGRYIFEELNRNTGTIMKHANAFIRYFEHELQAVLVVLINDLREDEQFN